MIAWFVAIGACGVNGSVDNPEILKALSPTYALTFLAGTSILRSLPRAIVLSVTGAEAAVCRHGSLGRRAITYGWLGSCFPRAR